MSTESNPQVTNDEPVLVLDNKKYVISELPEDARYIVNCLNALSIKQQNLQMEIDQVRVASEGFTTRLKDAVAEIDGEELPQPESTE
jgi:hypothetical protein